MLQERLKSYKDSKYKHTKATKTQNTKTQKGMEKGTGTGNINLLFCQGAIEYLPRKEQRKPSHVKNH